PWSCKFLGLSDRTVGMVTSDRRRGSMTFIDAVLVLLLGCAKADDCADVGLAVPDVVGDCARTIPPMPSEPRKMIVSAAISARPIIVRERARGGSPMARFIGASCKLRGLSCPSPTGRLPFPFDRHSGQSAIR